MLVGPNNEGKSNVLKAIAIALGLLSRSRYFKSQRQVRYRYGDEDDVTYRWDRDFPLALQSAQPDGRSEFVLEFELNGIEKRDFKAATKINLATNLKLKLSLGREDAKLELLLQGKAKQKVGPDLEQVARFVGEKLDIQYIPAIRPSALAESVVDDLLARELSQLEENPEYRELLVRLEAIQKPILQALGKELTKTVASFIPEVKTVRIQTGSGLRRALRNSSHVLVDDGNETELGRKGDGVKSLTAIALLRHTSQKSLGNRSLIFAIEEPESHLHPRAIHGLRNVLQEIAATNQVIVTTHSPVLVDRQETRRNIIVKDGRAVPAKHIREVRDALGVELSDNLASATLVLLVEGEEDRLLIQAWLPKLSTKLAKAITTGNLAIDTLNGATNLRYKAGLHKTHLCRVHALIDNDVAGRKSIDAALAAGVIEKVEYRATVCRGMENSELEDLLVQDTYENAIKSTFGVSLNPKFMSSNKKQWSDRVRDNFQDQGVPWSSSLERQVKLVVANAALMNGLNSLNHHRRGPIDSLVQQLEERLTHF
ncbi:MAG: AAA family ATPase [Betaproteobacteria bacterium]|nr:AAA family ATPase [Betaproteobacteria bacterium]